MRYTNYLLAIELLALVALVLVLFVKKTGSDKGLAGTDSADDHKAKKDEGGISSKLKSQLASYKTVKLQQQIKPIPTPWGWPGYKQNNSSSQTHTVSEAVRSFSRTLLHEKKEIGTPLRDARVNGSMRALLEDRYARVDKNTIKEIKYQKIHPPLLRDPSEPYDQMANFGTREAEKIRSRFGRELNRKSDQKEARTEFIQRVNLDAKELKAPWGW